ncbi:ribosomal protein S5 domain 2-type protein [Kalaharituber pfeilii]|nr:ribosomal protein S5 domain 2-type protein [Kalaharituber pfeilii]
MGEFFGCYAHQTKHSVNDDHRSRRPQPLFPPATYQKVDPSSYLLRHLQPPMGSSQFPIRPSGRSPHEFRTPTVHTSSLSHAHGSAVVRTGDTAVVCGVRGEILTFKGGEKKVIRSGFSPEDHGDRQAALKSYPLIVSNLELNTGCAAQYHPGPPSDFAQATTQRIKSLLLDVLCPVDVADLEIRGLAVNSGDSADHHYEVKAYWVLYVDTLMISLDGNAFDPAWAAIMAALADTKLPVARWDPDTARVVCDPVERKTLRIKSWGYSSSFGIFTAPLEEDAGEGEGGKTWILADPDDFEERVCEERILVVMRDGKRIAKIEKGGGKVGGLGIGVALAGVKKLKECIELAGDRWKEWDDLINRKED